MKVPARELWQTVRKRYTIGHPSDRRSPLGQRRLYRGVALTSDKKVNLLKTDMSCKIMKKL